MDFFYQSLSKIDRAFRYIQNLELSNYDSTLPDAGLLNLVSLCTSLKSLTLKTPSLPAEDSPISWPDKFKASLKNVERFHVLSHLTMLQRFEWIQPVGLYELATARASAEIRLQEFLGPNVSISVAPLKGLGVYRAYGGFTRYLKMWHASLSEERVESEQDPGDEIEPGEL